MANPVLKYKSNYRQNIVTSHISRLQGLAMPRNPIRNKCFVVSDIGNRFTKHRIRTSFQNKKTSSRLTSKVFFNKWKQVWWVPADYYVKTQLLTKSQFPIKKHMEDGKEWKIGEVPVALYLSKRHALCWFLCHWRKRILLRRLVFRTLWPNMKCNHRMDGEPWSACEWQGLKVFASSQQQPRLKWCWQVPCLVLKHRFIVLLYAFVPRQHRQPRSPPNEEYRCRFVAKLWFPYRYAFTSTSVHETRETVLF